MPSGSVESHYSLAAGARGCARPPTISSHQGIATPPRTSFAPLAFGWDTKPSIVEFVSDYIDRVVHFVRESDNRYTTLQLSS